ncbi:MAG: Ppx/GppA family phosphatase [Gemmatimonadetes bacterium]|nr:Ppx/GppA family phosphatase [Gemmatimonadota bacterium]
MYSFAPLERRVAIIDLGSNTARLMIAQYTQDRVFKITDEVSRRVRLGEGIAGDGRLRSAARSRALDAVRMFKSFCDAQGIDHILPVATAAVRDAGNGARFLEEITRGTGLNFRLISGEEEAFYSTVGVINSLGLFDGIILDVGGGSAEIGLIRDGAFAKGASTPFGTVRTTETYFPGPEVTPGQTKRLDGDIDRALEGIGWLKTDGKVPVAGVGGVVRALVRIDRMERKYPLGLVHGYELKRRRLEKLIERIASMPVSERSRRIPGLQKEREDIILGGAMIVFGVMRKTGARILTVSGQGLREGLFFEEAFKPASKPDSIGRLRRFTVLNLARLYGYEGAHTGHVARLSLSMYDQLQEMHGYGKREREYLWAAALLHDIGTVIDYYDHHKHSAYIILNAGLPGFDHREIVIIAWLCLNHRRGKPNFSRYQSLLKKEERTMVYRLSSLLRLSEYLDRSRAQIVEDVKLETGSRKVRMKVVPRDGRDVTVELSEARNRVQLFEECFGRRLAIELDRTGGKGDPSGPSRAN